MAGFVDFVLGLAFFIVLVASLIALVRPMPKLWLGTRKRALCGLGLALVIVFVAAVISPPKAKEQVAANAGSADAPREREEVEPEEPSLSEEQTNVVSHLRYIVMQSASCKGAVDQVQRQADNVVKNRARPIDAYEDAKRGIKACSEASAEFRRTDNLTGVPVSGHPLAKSAARACDKAAKARQSALLLVQEIMDGDGRLATASKYREHLNAAAHHEFECRSDLIAISERAKIPGSAVSFAKP